ncbi:hypothetical protein Pla52n_08620 [Stieleria varia]|uniref:Uncharacterized protein n=1 Tax=Stieleria varia TaxID=2528005 RepID=A0A5C6B8I9_9BACT|nr:hypothetical protein Pla52n_08620 [Stieleria varia]
MLVRDGKSITTNLQLRLHPLVKPTSKNSLKMAFTLPVPPSAFGAMVKSSLNFSSGRRRRSPYQSSLG